MEYHQLTHCINAFKIALMKKLSPSFFVFASTTFSLLLLSGCGKNLAIIQKKNDSVKTTEPTPTATPAPTLAVKKLSFVLTNDIHGHLEPTTFKTTGTYGGLATLGGLVDSLRKQPEYQNDEAGLFVLDSGDQFQGTLISNYDEGKAIFKAFNEIGYDAAVPGNHDYDFGPIGWLYDKVTDGQTSENPREVIEGLAAMAKFPLLSANTYYKASIKPQDSSVGVKLDSQCRPSTQSLKGNLDFSQAVRPSFLKPYVIIQKAGVRVALIGLDNHSTASTTTIENVEDLCFRDEIETYLEIRKSLEGQADVFVLLMHNGNSDNSKEGSDIVRKINEIYPKGVHLAAAGHTHFIHNDYVNGVRVIQDGAEAKYFGRVDLYFDPATHTVLSNQTNSKAGIQIHPTACDSDKAAFVCSQYPIPVQQNANIQKIIDDLNVEVAPMAKKVVATAKESIKRGRTDESAMGNILTDALRKATGTQIAFMNAGGVRTDLPAGTILYADVFEVLPFSNRAVIMNSLKWSTLKKVLTKAAQTCGNFGTLFQSGLRIQYYRDCSKGDIDYKARLIHVETIDGEVLFDETTATEAASDRTFKVTNLDFLASGGSGFADFKEATTDEVLGIARELIIDVLAKDQPILTNQLDGRFTNVAPAPVKSSKK